MRKRKAEVKCSAYHIAGHAVMVAHLGIKVDDVIVRRLRMGQSYEQTIQSDEVDLSPAGRLRIEMTSLVAFAGPEAEAMGCSQTIWHPCLRGDRECPAYLARVVCGSEQLSNDWLRSIRSSAQGILRALEREVNEIAEETIRTHERAVTEIALELMALETLTDDEVN